MEMLEPLSLQLILRRYFPANFEQFNMQYCIVNIATHLFLARLILDPEDGCDSFLRNVDSHTKYATLYRRRWQHSQLPLRKPQIQLYLLHGNCKYCGLLVN
jgi:hypothetical protein